MDPSFILSDASNYAYQVFPGAFYVKALVFFLPGLSVFQNVARFNFIRYGNRSDVQGGKCFDDVGSAAQRKHFQ